MRRLLLTCAPVVLAVAALSACGDARRGFDQATATPSSSPTSTMSATSSAAPPPVVVAAPAVAPAQPARKPPVPPTSRRVSPGAAIPPAVQRVVVFANCAAARAAGKAPLRRGQPGYSAALDRDHDGVACE